MMQLTWLKEKADYFTVRFINGLVQSKLPGGILCQPRDNLFINREIYIDRVYERLRGVKKGDVVIDIGAHVGIFTLRASRRAANGLVVAIEPHPLNYKLLVENVRRNELKNVVTLNMALSSYDGVTKLYISDQSGRHSTARHFTGKYVEVIVKKLDSVLKDLKLEGVNMIKIDVEGDELRVLKGAEDTLRRNNVYLAIAAYHTPTEVQELSKFLLDKKMRIAVFKRARARYVYAWRQ